MTLAASLCHLGEIPAIHRVTRGRFCHHIQRLNRTLSPGIVTTKDGFKIKTDPLDSLALRTMGEYEPEVRAEMRRIIREGDLVVDVGAHIGYHTVLMASLGAKVIAIEPVWENLKLLGHNLSLNGFYSDGDTIELWLVAASNDTGQSIIWIDPKNSGSHSMEIAAGRTPIEIGTLRLDDALSPGPIRLIKMDVEGHEFAVIQGLGDRLQDVDYIIYEWWGPGRGTKDPADLLKGWDIRHIAGDNYIAKRKS